MTSKINTAIEEPFIKKFKTKKNFYIYDVNTNEILKVDEIIYDIFDDIYRNDINFIKDKFKFKYSTSLIERSYNMLKDAQSENKYFLNFRPEISLNLKSTNDFKKILNSELEQLILEVTNRCNQRCRYCAFSGRYRYQRTHSTKDLCFDVAKRAVDFFIERSNKNSDLKPNISFYGGEPLLNFELIKKIINYVKHINEFKKFRFSITTNGTLLSSDVIDYLVNNEISITISLDGPEEIHDRYRVFANGRKTFANIMKNLSYIYNSYTDYFRNHILVNAILAPPYDFKRIIDFFYVESIFKDICEKVRFNFVDDYGTSFFKDYDLEICEQEKYNEIAKLEVQYIDSLIEGNYYDLTIEKQFFDRSFYNIDNREMTSLGKTFPPLGTCLPGKRRLFVNTEGKFFMCEKVNSNYEIGNVYAGFNHNQILTFFLKFGEFFKDCNSCWALRFCSKCFNNIQKGEEFDELRRHKLCKYSMYSIENDLITYCEIREKNIDAFKVLENVIFA